MIFIQIQEQLKSLSNLLLLLNDDQYNQRITFLGNASIGGHSRHIIELLKCAIDGYNSGTVDYVNRVRDIKIETERLFALQQLSLLTNQMLQPDKSMKLVLEVADANVDNYVSTTYFREIVYNAEHALHHLALIRVALREMQLEIVANDFGMAYSTINYLASRNEMQN